MTKRTILWLCIIVSQLFSLSAPAQSETADELKPLYKEFLRLYRTEGHDEEFYKVAEEISQYYKDHDQLNRYYTTQLNICLYDTEHDQPYKALKRANEMLEEMEAGHNDAYENVYMALGTVYESRGNRRMAQHFYEETLTYTSPEEYSSLLAIESRLAYLLMFTDPATAKDWNDKCDETSKLYPEYRQVYHVINAIVAFAQGDKEAFRQAYADYLAHRREQPDLDDYGTETLKAIDLAFNGQIDEAIARLPRCKSDLNDVNKYDMAIKLYEMKGDLAMALQTEREKGEFIDSLNSDMLFNNMNELNAQTGVNRANAEASKARSQTTNVVMLLSFVIIAILTFCLFFYRKTKDRLKEKNEQLHAALLMAEEGEKMKTEFVRSVSHEIRTPLNAINGFNDILNNPNIELTPEERHDLTERINANVQAITNIVDEMLHIADKESNEFYPKENTIYCNHFLSAILYGYRDRVNGSIELNYTTRVINRFQIETNEEGLRKVVDHLIQNAVKFTSKGFIELHCEVVEDQLLISVTDTGCGIEKSQRSKIFESFYKADVFQQGIGLGLAVSKKIAKKLGGDLTLDESYHEGARFVLSLPL